MNAKRSSRMSAIPSLPSLQVPEIFIDDGENDDQRQKSPPSNGKQRPNLTVATDFAEGRKSAWAGGNGSPLHGDHRGHPLSFPRSDNSAVSTPTTPAAFSFDMQRSDRQASPSRSTGNHSGAVSPAEAAAQQMLDESVWIQSIDILKRKTLRKSDRTSYRYGDLG